MSGLDKINSHILEEANQTAAAKLAEAREKAELRPEKKLRRKQNGPGRFQNEILKIIWTGWLLPATCRRSGRFWQQSRR